MPSARDGAPPLRIDCWSITVGLALENVKVTTVWPDALVVTFATSPTLPPLASRDRVNAAAALPFPPAKLTAWENVTTNDRTSDRWLPPPLTATVATAGGAAAVAPTSNAPMSAAEPTTRGVNPRWSVGRLAGLDPALMSGLVDCRAIVRVGPPLFASPAAA